MIARLLIVTRHTVRVRRTRPRDDPSTSRVLIIIVSYFYVPISITARKLFTLWDRGSGKELIESPQYLDEYVARVRNRRHVLTISSVRTNAWTFSGLLLQIMFYWTSRKTIIRYRNASFLPVFIPRDGFTSGERRKRKTNAFSRQWGRLITIRFSRTKRIKKREKKRRMTRMVIKRVRRETLVTIITRKRVGRILYVVPVENTRTRISNADEYDSGHATFHRVDLVTTKRWCISMFAL